MSAFGGTADMTASERTSAFDPCQKFTRQDCCCAKTQRTSRGAPGMSSSRLLVWHDRPALATALVASVANPRAFRSGRDFSAWIGPVPKQNSSGGKPKLGGISKQGDRYPQNIFDDLELGLELSNDRFVN
jgi:transposase IS116/IS110/IS902 family protein